MAIDLGAQEEAERRVTRNRLVCHRRSRLPLQRSGLAAEEAHLVRVRPAMRCLHGVGERKWWAEIPVCCVPHTVHERWLLGWRAEGESGGVFRAEPTGEVDSARSIP